MTFNLNFDPKLLRSAVDALVQLAADYRDVHYDDIEAGRRRRERRESRDASKGAVFYQSDRKLHEQEVKEQQRKELEWEGKISTSRAHP